MKRPVTLVLVASLLVSASAFAGKNVSSQIASRVVANDSHNDSRHGNDRGNDNRGGGSHGSDHRGGKPHNPGNGHDRKPPNPPGNGGGHDRRDDHRNGGGPRQTIIA
jgi:hypothetical protein